MVRDLFGMKFGRLSVVERAGSNKSNRALWYCMCDCGKDKITTGSGLLRGTCKSCGCLSRESFIENKRKPVHGMCKTRQYGIWHSMKQRCLNPNQEHYSCYGGRGITICDKWLTFKGFWDDMQDGYLDTLTIDRIDNNGNYEKTNCRWATQREQHSNKRTNIIITINGVTQTFKQHCESHGINYSTAINRVARHGYNYIDAVLTPTKSKFAPKR